MINIDLVVGARPNFVKAAALIAAAKNYPDRINMHLIHTGQHSNIMSDPFFKELSLPEPFLLELGQYSPNPATRLAQITGGLVHFWHKVKPDFAMVVGDCDSTLAGAIAAAKSGIDVIHVEAGLRCGDRQMQEEINRVMVDSISDILYTSTEGARENLIRESNPGDIRFVGNVMVDTLYKYLPQAKASYPRQALPKSYAMLTLHRAENVDNPSRLEGILKAVNDIAREIPVIWPVHPRVQTLAATAGAWNIDKYSPFGYHRFIATMASAKFVMTDSGGVQEETTALGVPCLTIRESTERPETVSHGTNLVVGTDPESILRGYGALQVGEYWWRAKGKLPLWDGNAATRIMEDLVS